MTDFLVLPVQEAVAWLRAWTDHSWPMTLQEAFTIRDHLGWKPAPDDGRFFTTKLATDGQEDGSIDRVDDHPGFLGGVGRIQVDQRMLPHPARQDGEIPSDRLDVKAHFGPLLLRLSLPDPGQLRRWLLPP